MTIQGLLAMEGKHQDRFNGATDMDVAWIQAEARASAVEETVTNGPFAAGPMIRELRDLICVLPDRALLHALLGFCLKRIEEFDAARASLSEAESLLRARGHVEIADKLRNFSERLAQKV